MSTLKVNTIQNTSGGSGSTPEQIEQGRAKAWVTINTTGSSSIADSFNISSVSETNTWTYVANFSTAMADANYCVVCNITKETNQWAVNTSTSSVTLGSGSQLTDGELVQAVVFS